MIRCELTNGDYFGITDRMQGKMEGVWSLNTSAECNPFCKRMRGIDGYICQSCYSKNTERRWKYSRLAWENNYRVLSENSLKDREVPILNTCIFRHQAHGDLINRTHYKNLVRVAEGNPGVTFALWTKNLGVINRGGVIKRDNLIHVYSTPQLNNPNPKLPKGFDRVFSVYTRPFTRETKVKVNCGAKNCLACQLCYTKSDVVFVNEHIKANGHKKTA